MLGIEKLADKFAQVACHLSLKMYIRPFLIIRKSPTLHQFFKTIDKGITIVESENFNYLIDISSYTCALLTLGNILFYTL